MTTTNKRKQQPSSCPKGWHPAGHVTPMSLTFKQQIYCRRAVGISRFIHNLCVTTHRFHRNNRMKWPSWQDLSKAFNACKREDYTFVTEVSKHIVEGAFRDFGKSIKNWRDPKHSAGPPRFHKKRITGSGSFRAAAGVVKIKYNGKRRIQLPGLGSIKLDHTLPEGIIYEAHIKFLNGQWMLSINYWAKPIPVPDPDERIEHGAVDTGINPLTTDSEGQTWENPKAYYQAERKLNRWQRSQARRTTQSRGWWEAQRKIDRLNRRTVGLRKNAQHQMTAAVVHKFQNVVIEDLNVAGMMQGITPKAQADAGMGEVKRQIIYKGDWSHTNVSLAHRFYPSSKTCSNCGEVNAKLKREPTWQCPSCGTTHERNLNAAVNLSELLTLPADSGMMLRNGKALTVGLTSSETGPNDRRTATQRLRPAHR